MKFRNLIGSLGLMGALGFSPKVSAQDTAVIPVSVSENEKYLDFLTEAEVQAEILRRAQRFRYEDIKRLEGNEDFDGVIIASSTCHHNTDGRNRRDEIVFLRLMDYFDGAKSLNGDPLVFGYFDQCGRSGGELIGFDGLSFGMYLDGKRIDTLQGFPDSDESIIEWYDFLSSKWIPTNLISPNGQYAWRF
ncbi:hypothetical protein J4467_03410, partial [Candidatus Woesearchaeota archaeon]|nr:hypothetical protein [Candidatus Woesearchaeota archaeon]